MKLCLNVGSGQRPFKTTESHEWVNIDKVVHEGMPCPDLLCDGSQLPYHDESVDHVVLHHCLEHEGCNEGLPLIREAHRVLKIGGTLQVYVPDMQALATGWLQGRIDTQVYLTCVYGAYMGHESDRHKWGFNSPSLNLFLYQIPSWKETHTPCLLIPGSDCAHDWWILEIEAVK